MLRFIMITIICWFALQLGAKTMGQFGIGLDLNGKQSFSNATLGSDSDVKTGVSLYGEILTSGNVGPGALLYGLGLEYQVPRALKNLSPDEHKREFSFLPIYVTAKYVFLPISISPEVIVQAGYNLPITHKNYDTSDTNGMKVSGGFYWGMGAGIDIKPFVLQVMYKSIQSNFKWNDIDSENLTSTNTNSQLSIQLGIRL